jgi:hypothetical protein
MCFHLQTIAMARLALYIAYHIVFFVGDCDINVHILSSFDLILLEH